MPDAVEYNKGNIVEAYQKGQTVRIGMLTDSEGKPMADTIVSAIEKNLTDYDRAWMAAWKTLNARMTGYINETSMLLSGVKKATTENYIHINVDGDTNLEQNKGIRYDNSAADRAWIGSMENFFGSYTTDLINETSMKLLGYKRAVVKNYYPIAVNKKALATQIEGLHLDATIEGRGFLKNRVKSPQPILLEECNNVLTGHGSLRGPGPGHPGCAEGAEQPDRDRGWTEGAEERHSGGKVGQRCGELCG